MCVLFGKPPVKVEHAMKRVIRTFSNDETLVDERRKQIIKCASTLFLKKGYDRTNMRDLGKALGMTIGGLYHYIGSKDDILHLVLDFTKARNRITFQRIHQRVSKLRPTEALQKSVQMYLESVDEYQDMYNFLNHVIVILAPADRRIIFSNQTSETVYFERLLAKGIQTGEFKIDDPVIIAHDIVVMGNAWANRRWFLRKRYTLKQYTRRHIELIMKQIGADTSCAASSRNLRSKSHASA